MILDILKVLFGILAVLLLIKVLMKDIKKAGKYKHAKTVMARVISADGSKDLKVYGRSQYRTYYKYTVEFTIPQGTYTGTLLIKESGLQNGELVEVRYDIDEDGAHLLNDLSSRRLKEIIVTAIIVIPLCIVILYFKTKS